MIRWQGLVLAVLAVILPAAMLGSLWLGVYPVSPLAVGRVLLGIGPVADTQRVVVEIIRLPRVALATLVGVGLGLSGAALQGMLRNPLVGPDIIGVSSGAACGGVLAISLSWAPAGVVASAFAGGLLALTAAVTLARAAGVLGMVLAGVLVGAFGSALVGLAEFMADPNSTLPNIVYWLMGSFAGADRAKVAIVAGAVTLGGGGLLALRWRLNLLSLGDEDAASLGVPVVLLRWVVIGLVTLIVAAQVAVSGVVGWIGLIVPHMARALVGPDHRRLIPASGLLGGLMGLGVDDLARTIASQEIPVGLLSALVGAPVFAFIFRRAQRSGWRPG